MLVRGRMATQPACVLQGTLTPGRTCCRSGAVDACGVCDGDGSLCVARAALRACLRVDSAQSVVDAADPSAALAATLLPSLCALLPWQNSCPYCLLDCR